MTKAIFQCRFRRVAAIALAVLPFAVYAGEPDGVVVSGEVLYSGRVQPAPMAADAGASVAIDDPAARPLEAVFVYLEIVDAPVPEMPEDPAPVHMNQVGMRFRPLVLSATAGQPVVFGNDDSTDHNIRGISEQAENEFNIITRPEHTYERRFDPQPLIAPLRLACDFHPSMEAWIYIVDGPWHQVTGEDGAFCIGPVPPGRYRLHVRDPNYRMAASTELDLRGGRSVEATVTFGVPHKYYRAEPPIRVRKLEKPQEKG